MEPSEAELRVLQEQFDLQELAVEDALLDHHAPKLEVYGKSLEVGAIRLQGQPAK